MYDLNNNHYAITELNDYTLTMSTQLFSVFQSRWNMKISNENNNYIEYSQLNYLNFSEIIQGNLMKRESVCTLNVSV